MLNYCLRSFKNRYLPRESRIRYLPNLKTLHTSKKIAQSGFRPSNFMSSLTHSPQVILSCPKLHLHHLHFSASQYPMAILHSYAPDAQTISIWHASPHQQHSETKKAVQISIALSITLKDTPHIHLTIIRSALFRLFQIFIAYVSVPHVGTLRTQALCIFP